MGVKHVKAKNSSKLNFCSRNLIKEHIFPFLGCKDRVVWKESRLYPQFKKKKKKAYIPVHSSSSTASIYYVLPGQICSPQRLGLDGFMP